MMQQILEQEVKILRFQNAELLRKVADLEMSNAMHLNSIVRLNTQCIKLQSDFQLSSDFDAAYDRAEANEGSGQ